MDEALLKQRRKMVRIGIALLEAWQCKCHEEWRDPVCGHVFDVLVKEGLMETRAPHEGDPEIIERKLTCRGLVALCKLQDALTEGLR